MELHLTARTVRHLSYRITQRYLQVNTPRLNPSQTGWYSIYLPGRDERLSWQLTRQWSETTRRQTSCLTAC